ncbi:MAG: Ldh family oxidoreductase, partial [Alphaproteobacteria bacterium]
RKARQAGCAAVGVVDSADPYMIGYYVDRIARAGLVGFIFQSSGPLVHPHGGSEAVMGTNPLAIAIPTAGDDPIVLDMATSALSHSRVRQARYHEDLLPEGSGFDAEGRPTREAARIEVGAIAPLGGHKGFGLSLAVGLLCGPLVGAAVGKGLAGWLGQGGPTGPMGQLLLAIDPSAFGDATLFRKRVSAYLAEIKGSRKAPGSAEIRIPGERSAAARERSLEDGVPILEACWRNTEKLAAELGVAMPA